MNTKIIKLDINKNLYDILVAKQGDTKSRFLLFNLLDGSIPFSLENRSVRVYAIKPDGTEVFNDLIITDAAKGYCILELTTQMLAVAGTVKLELMVMEGDKKLTSNIFYMDVKESINSEKAVVSTNEFGTLLTALASLNEYDNYKNEIAAARNGQAKLKDRLDNFDEQLDNKVNKTDQESEMVSRRVRGQNSTDSPAGAFDFANFAKQGQETGLASTPIGGIIHHYTDGKVIQIDNVGENNVILTMVNANNPTRRPDKDPTFFGKGYFLQLFTNNQNKRDDVNTGGIYDHLTIDEKGMLFWSGYTPSGNKTNSTTFTTGKEYGYTPAFVFNAIQEHEDLLHLKTNDKTVLSFKYNKSTLGSEIYSPSSMDGLNIKTGKGDIRLQPISGKNVRVDYTIYNNKQDGRGAKEVAVIDYGLTSERPTTNLQCGMMFFDRTLNKPIWRNKDNNGWVDATGTSV